jgi:hypothetical protein
MTTEAIERVSIAESRAFPAQIPEWVPPRIAERARDSFGDFRHSPEYHSALVRLTTDPRMQAVWSHLTRKRRLDGQFLQPARSSIKGEASQRQDFAMLRLFCAVLQFAECRPRTMLRREIEARQEQRKAIAQKLWAEADTLGYLEELGESAPGRAKILSEAGCVLWQMAAAPDIGDIVVERDRGERDIQAVTMAIAGACSWLFGAPLYAVTATLTAVALDCDVTARKVREWGPILPSADKGSFFGLLSAVCKP